MQLQQFLQKPGVDRELQISPSCSFLKSWVFFKLGSFMWCQDFGGSILSQILVSMGTMQPQEGDVDVVEERMHKDLHMFKYTASQLII